MDISKVDYHNLLNYIRSLERRVAMLESQLRNPYFPPPVLPINML